VSCVRGGVTSALTDTKAIPNSIYQNLEDEVVCGGV